MFYYVLIIGVLKFCFVYLLKGSFNVKKLWIWFYYDFLSNFIMCMLWEYWLRKMELGFYFFVIWNIEFVGFCFRYCK